MEDLKEAKVSDEKIWKWKLKRVETAKVIKKKRAVVCSIKSLEADIMRLRVLLLKRKVICHFLPNQNLFIILFIKRANFIQKLTLQLKNEIMNLRIFRGTWRKQSFIFVKFITWQNTLYTWRFHEMLWGYQKNKCTSVMKLLL